VVIAQGWQGRDRQNHQEERMGKKGLTIVEKISGRSFLDSVA
jgi:hypothetical protein